MLCLQIIPPIFHFWLPINIDGFNSSAMLVTTRSGHTKFYKPAKNKLK